MHPINIRPKRRHRVANNLRHASIGVHKQKVHCTFCPRTDAAAMLRFTIVDEFVEFLGDFLYRIRHSNWASVMLIFLWDLSCGSVQWRCQLDERAPLVWSLSMRPDEPIIWVLSHCKRYELQAPPYLSYLIFGIFIWKFEFDSKKQKTLQWEFLSIPTNIPIPNYFQNSS
jgi:hypothetical protein